MIENYGILCLRACLFGKASPPSSWSVFIEALLLGVNRLYPKSLLEAEERLDGRAIFPITAISVVQRRRQSQRLCRGRTTHIRDNYLPCARQIAVCHPHAASCYWPTAQFFLWPIWAHLDKLGRLAFLVWILPIIVLLLIFSFLLVSSTILFNSWSWWVFAFSIYSIFLFFLISFLFISFHYSFPSIFYLSCYYLFPFPFCNSCLLTPCIPKF